MKDSNPTTFLSFDNVKKSYDQKNLVVKGFDMDVQQGEFITLLGPSGSGKTTVLMMLLIISLSTSSYLAHIITSELRLLGIFLLLEISFILFVY